MIPAGAEHCVEGWIFQTRYAEDVVFGDITIKTEGLVYTHPLYGMVSGASSSHRQEESTAAFELIERILLVKHLFERNNSYYTLRCPFDGSVQGRVKREHVFPVRSRSDVNVVSSNGVALHSDWSLACISAALELVERHVVLESFYGRLKPRRIVSKGLFADIDPKDIYREESYLLGIQKVDAYSQEIYVAVSLLVPQNPDTHHQIIAFGSAFNCEEAQRKAQKEALQRYSFVYDSPIPSQVEFEASGLYHQNFHFMKTNHWQIIDWLQGKLFVADSQANKREILELDFVDLSLEEASPWVLAKAISANAHELVWGAMDETLFESALVNRQLVHPIP